MIIDRPLVSLLSRCGAETNHPTHWMFSQNGWTYQQFHRSAPVSILKFTGKIKSMVCLEGYKELTGSNRNHVPGKVLLFGAKT